MNNTDKHVRHIQTLKRRARAQYLLARKFTVLPSVCGLEPVLRVFVGGISTSFVCAIDESGVSGEYAIARAKIWLQEQAMSATPIDGEVTHEQC
jgi:hypothetical protein